MLKYLFLFLIFLIPLTTSAYSLVTKVVDGHPVRVFVIPHDDVYRVTAVASNTGSTLRSLIENGRGVAGINGAYFIPRDYTGKADSTNTVRIMNHDGLSYSKYYPDTGINAIFGFDSTNLPVLIQNNVYGERSLRDNYNSGMILSLRSGIANFPILLANSINLIPRYDALGMITDKMKIRSTKSFICRTMNNDVKMGTIEKISMVDVPSLIRQFGCVDAINLDNGGSLAMYASSKYIVGPGRNIMDAFVIVRK
jgi:exopolysaccharide biosynthesis protein